ncbi:uncharacterized protein LOC112905601 isoform X2 [Agrilus planipennis]|uniref:Uncharacterized protein LOC112905601 isoform X2 n=1 Tax=Agrilus planipennis TaxID=224129 RepID=A0A7F5RDP1_AGRPL|nr:uncharacterized protein LOC112905601 isoform X2 [Agrilus planipennis]
METRSRKILNMLNLPRYETTKCLDKEYRELAINNFQDASISSTTDKPPAISSPEILPIPSIQFDLDRFEKLQNVRTLNFEDEEELISEPEPFGSGDSESEYLPSGESRSSSIVPDTPENTPLSDTECAQPSQSLPVNLSENYSSMESDEETDNFSSGVTSSTNKIKTKELVKINCPKKTSSGKRIRNKDHSCYFCHKLLRNLARHFERIHSNETEVARILSMPKNSKKRREAFNALTRNGDFYHNCDVLLLKKGELILTRRPTEHERKFLKYSDYGPCPECLGFMIKRHIWHHLKYSCICLKDKNILNSEKSRLPANESTSLLNGIYGHNLTEDFRSNVLNKLRNDDISEKCRQDDLILRFGAFMYEKYSSTQAELIRQSMRQLGRLTVELAKKNTDVLKLTDALTPDRFDDVVLATKSLCITSKEIAKRTEFGIPSLALKIGYSIRKCIGIERGLCLRNGDLKRNEILLSFLTILDLEWSVRISSNALATLQSRKFNSVDLLPVTGDLIKLSKFLEFMIQETKKNMEREKSFQNWSKLASLTLSRIILFNKRRSGEAARMKIEHYTKRASWKSQGVAEMKESLTEFEIKLANALTVVEIIGKRGRKVPVLLTKEMKESVDFLLATRTAVEVPEGNPFVFARLGDLNSHMRGHDCIKKWCCEANLESPETITSTKLRKYVATVCQVFNLKESECDWLARHLGHDIRVHREFYRLHENTVELTKVSRLLLAVDQGKAHAFAGKSLEDIEVKDLPPIEEDPFDNDDEADDGEDEEIMKKGEELFDPFIGKEKQKESNKRKRTKREAALGRIPWNDSEKEVLLNKFKMEIKNEIVPGKDMCTKIKEEHDNLLSNRSWTDIKFFVKNVITRNKKNKK